MTLYFYLGYFVSYLSMAHVLRECRYIFDTSRKENIERFSKIRKEVINSLIENDNLQHRTTKGNHYRSLNKNEVLKAFNDMIIRLQKFIDG